MKNRLFAIIFGIALLFSAAASEPAVVDTPIVLQSGDVSIHFLELGNKYTGDCVYINYGTIDILIDAGSKQSSAAAIKAYIDTYIKDNKLEYVIATHAHEDHIAGFSGSKNVPGILESYETGLIIDFPKTNSASAVYKNYIEARAKAIANGAVHYTALECFNNKGNAERVYDLGGGVKIEILYNWYYENQARNENNYSVCLKIIQNEYQYLFTGDLEKEGEEKLVDYYEENFGGLGRCVLYKGGHHGSNTSSSEKLLEAITPEYVCVCSCAGSLEYRASPPNVFPGQDFADRIAPYTDRVYITTIVTDYSKNEYGPFNGTVIFLVSKNTITVICSNNSLKLKDTEWFRKNRTMPEPWKLFFPFFLHEATEKRKRRREKGFLFSFLPAPYSLSPAP